METITTLDMAVVDRNCEYLGIPRRILMENAGRGVAEVIRSRFGKCRVTVVAGLGDNGGDGIVAARYLHEWGCDVKIVLLGRAQDFRSDLARTNYEICKLLGIETFEVSSPLELQDVYDLIITWCDVLVDAIIGTGLRGALREPQYTAIRMINMSRAKKVAVDVPSGLDPDTGQVSDTAVIADITVTMHKPKPGLLMESAKRYVGELIVVDIGIPREAEHVVGPGDLLYLNWKRRKESKKGDHGRVVIVGGSLEFSGAPTLAALACYRSGVDLVTVVAPEAAAHDVRAGNPNIIAYPVKGDYFRPEHVDEILKICERAHAVLIGPGLGTREETMKFVVELLRKLQQTNIRIVIDADAIKAIAQLNARELLTNNVVVTAHAGEFRQLIGDVPKIANIWKRAEEVRNLVEQRTRGAVVVLKGNVDIVTDGNRYKLNLTGNPAMTVGGTGDILSGTVAGLVTKTHDIFEAACIATFIVGLAGDLAAIEKGYHILPTDVLEKMPTVFTTLLNERQEIRNILHTPSRNIIKDLGLVEG